jgi:glucuronosyltransferase
MYTVHSNIRLFVTHGGQTSLQEAVTRGVLTVGIPVFADQRPNMARAVLAGYGLIMDRKNITSLLLIWAIEESIESPK